MIVEFHGLKCRYGTLRIAGENKPVLTLVNQSDWEKSLKYDFTELIRGLWCHVMTEQEVETIEELS